jgi:large subunit ribosomal protein L21
MYAIIKTGGKQYRVKEGDIIDVELIGESAEVKFNEVLFFFDGQKSHVGLPHVPKCVVHGEYMGLEKGPKVIAYKYKRCKNSRRTVGHRQKYSRVKITKIAAA